MRITCSIPNLPGGTVTFLNNLGHNIIIDYARVVRESTSTVSNYHLNLTWTQDNSEREKLRIIQCKATFHGSTYPCKTAVVNVNFLDINQGMLQFIFTFPCLNY